MQQAILEFRDAAESFFLKNSIVKTNRDQAVEPDEALKAQLDRDAAREMARDRFDELSRDINMDLRTL